LGGGAINGRDIQESRYDFTRGLPLVSISYGRFFIGAVPAAAPPAGARGLSPAYGTLANRSRHWRGRPQAAASTDDPILRGWGDIKGTARGGAFASYTRDWLSVRGSISDDIGGHHEGVLASLAVEAKYMRRRV